MKFSPHTTMYFICWKNKHVLTDKKLVVKRAQDKYLRDVSRAARKRNAATDRLPLLQLSRGATHTSLEWSPFISSINIPGDFKMNITRNEQGEIIWRFRVSSFVESIEY